MATIPSNSLLGEAEPLAVLDADFGRLVRIWWALVWRSIFALVCATVLAAGIAFAASLLLGMLAAAVSLPAGVADRIAEGLASVLGVGLVPASSLVAVRSVLGKHFHGFRLVLLELR